MHDDLFMSELEAFLFFHGGFDSESEFFELADCPAGAAIEPIPLSPPLLGELTTNPPPSRLPNPDILL
ncbi:hypothetical protein [Haloferula rosea]|uniref:Uncharacterized protein n=1 Tax=Haloferula rosea TaxID=490093 RepID=A0A934RE42_9BACT|nr:hypothetical protein [Haloferula rosea]MBK1826896.1 hypothetical protein [Haloferula rosea]